VHPLWQRCHDWPGDVRGVQAIPQGDGCETMTTTKFTARVGEMNGGAWNKPISESGWCNGHQYADNGNLLQVLCPEHGGRGFPRGAVTTGTGERTGGVR
jgi:hypothetical protein